jgi:hypothetical protein
MAPDGRSFVTAVALQTSSLWIHDSKGERQISVEGNAADQTFTPDGKKLLFRRVKEPPSEYSAYRELGEVWVADVESGRAEPLVRGLTAHEYDVSPDGRQVVIATVDSAGKPRLWLVPLDRSSPPHQIPNVEGGAPRFLPNGDILFRVVGGTSYMGSLGYVYRIHPDGSGLEQAFEQPVLLLGTVSPDGKWLISWALLPNNGAPASQAFSLDRSQAPVVLGPAIGLDWSRDGESVAVFSAFGSVLPENRCYLIPLPHGQALPRVPVGGFQTERDIAGQPGARPLDFHQVIPGVTADTYSFHRGAIQRNLYRVPIQ